VARIAGIALLHVRLGIGDEQKRLAGRIEEETNLMSIALAYEDLLPPGWIAKAMRRLSGVAN
jgi:hypothetical protein